MNPYKNQISDCSYNCFMKKNIYILLTVSVLAVIVVWYFLGKGKSTATDIKVPVKKGPFEISVITTGELEAQRSENITGPEGLQAIQIWGEIKINKLIPEGTVVDSGQFIASLDQTEVVSKLKDLENELQKLESQFIKTKLDTSLDLRNARNELINLKFNLEEMQIALDQSKYEPPAIQRQAKINLEKAERSYSQAVENYYLRTDKSKAQMQEVAASLEQAQRRKERMVSILDQFTIRAPKSGMIIYQRNWRGRKRETGSSINAWDNVVATLPDLSKMIIKTYVNEIDISKISVGQNVKINVDAFPERKYSGTINEVANIGEQNPGSDAKVFEVRIGVKESDSILRPAMTTKNSIITAIIDTALYIPLEAIHNDSITFVYKDDGYATIKQQVETGESNDNEIVIKRGLLESDQVYLTIPENSKDLKVVLLETIKK